MENYTYCIEQFFQDTKNDFDEQSYANIGSQAQEVLSKLSTLNIEKSFEQQLGVSDIDNLQ